MSPIFLDFSGGLAAMASGVCKGAPAGGMAGDVKASGGRAVIAGASGGAAADGRRRAVVGAHIAGGLGYRVVGAGFPFRWFGRGAVAPRKSDSSLRWNDRLKASE